MKRSIQVKKIIQSCLLGIFSCWVSAAAFASPVDQLNQLLGGFSTYQAHFKQWTVNDQQQIQSQTSGVFMIERPNKFRWVTAPPDNQVIIANGNKLWHYDRSLQQATQQTLKPGSQAGNPAALLSSKVQDLSNQFTISKVTLKGQQWFKLLPKQTQNYKEIFLYFNQNQLTSIIVVNNLGDRTLFQFDHIQLNHVIPASAFEFTPPKGVDVDVQQ